MEVYYGFILINLSIVICGCIYDYFYEEDGLVITLSLIFWALIFVVSSFVGFVAFVLILSLDGLDHLIELSKGKIVFKFKKEKK